MEYYMKKSDRKTRSIDCYNSSQKILLVGEGDFSFSACLARAFGTAKNMVATSYLDEDSLFKKHWTSIPHLKELERLGCSLLSKVDVYNMQNTLPILKNTKFDIIIFNFPHAGHYDYLSESSPILIQMHRELVGAYFRNASKMLSEGGEVHIRHRDDSPYDRWDIVSLAAEAGLKLKEKVFFDKSEYPGYHQKRGGDVQTNKTFPIGYAFTYKFQTRDLTKLDDDHDQGYVLEMKKDLHNIFVHMFDGLCLKDDDDEEEEKDGDEDEKGYDEDYNYDDDDNDEKGDNKDYDYDYDYDFDYDYDYDDDDDEDDEDEKGYDEDNNNEEDYYYDYYYDNPW